MAVSAILRRMTPLDRLIVLLLFLGAAASFFLLGRRPKGERVIVEQDGRIVFTAPLHEDRSIALSGPHGETIVTILGGRACVSAASCPNKACMGMGEISRKGEMIACVPNLMLMHVEAAADDGAKDYDFLSR